MVVSEHDLYRAYRGARLAALDRTVVAVITLNAIEERIAELWRWRTWDRTHRWAEWSTLRQERTVELRALVRLARRARRLAR